MNSPVAAALINSPPAPELEQNPGNPPLDPVLVRNNLTVVINYPMQPGESLQVIWTAAPGAPSEASFTTVFFPVGGTAPWKVPLPNWIVAYSLNNVVTVTYVVMNGTTPITTSLPLTVTIVPLAQSALPIPLITQAPNNGIGSVLDVAFLTHFTLRINGWPLITDGQYFWMSLSGINDDGSAFYIEYWIAPNSVVTQAFLQSGFYAETFSALPLKRLKHGSTLTLDFRAALDKKLNKNAALKFAPRHYTINNDAQMRLLAPAIVEAKSSSQLDPRSARYTLTARLSFPVITGARVRVRWIGAPGTSPEGSVVTAYVDAGATGTEDVSLPNSVVAFNLGQTVTVIFDLMVGDAPAVSSLPLMLNVRPLAQNALPQPIIREALGNGHGNELDLTSLKEFTLFIEGWPLIAVGQYFWVSLIGILADGGVFNVEYVIAPHPPVDQSFVTHDFFSQIFSTTPLNLLMDGSTLTVQLRVALDKSLSKSSAVKFPAKQYTVKTGGPIPQDPMILAVKDSAGNDITNGGTTNATQVTISGSAMAGQPLEILDGQTVIGMITAVSGVWELAVSALTGGLHVFTARPLNGGGGGSTPWTIDVVLLNLELTIAEAPDNGNLDPLAALTRLTAVLDYNMQANDRIRVIWTAAPGTPAAGSHTTNTVQAGTTIRPRIIQLPVTLLAFSLGKRVTVSFEYDRGTAPPVVSRPLVLNIGTIPADRFDPPVITQANGTTVLNLADVQLGATLLFGIWPLIASGQPIWLDLEGQNASGGSHNLTMWTGLNFAVHRSWVLNGRYSVTVLFSYLKDLAEGSTLSIHFRVNMDQVPNPATAVVFAARQYTIRAIP